VDESLQHARVCACSGQTRGHGPSWATGTRALPFKFFSKSAQILKFKMMVFPMSKIHLSVQVDSLKHKEVLYFLDQLQNPKGLKVINSGTNSNLNLP
jgi:hypothetical protein